MADEDAAGERWEVAATTSDVAAYPRHRLPGQ